MKVTEEFLEYILDMLSSLGQVDSARMFGGVLLKVEGQQLGVILHQTLYFKVTDAVLQEVYAKQGSVQFSYTRKDKKDPVVIKNWWSVPESALDDPEELVKLAQEVLSQK